MGTSKTSKRTGKKAGGTDAVTFGVTSDPDIVVTDTVELFRWLTGADIPDGYVRAVVREEVTLRLHPCEGDAVAVTEVVFDILKLLRKARHGRVGV